VACIVFDIVQFACGILCLLELTDEYE
jgi:hypothetical protein